MNILYYDCFAGISGDMHLGALFDLGVDPDLVRKELSRLDLSGWNLKVRKETKQGIQGTRIDVAVEAHESHHRHTRYRDIRALVDKSSLKPEVKETALRIFSFIAEAEARIHGTSVGDVAFHEVGAVDSIIDIVGAAVCIHQLKPDRIVSSPVQLGSGFVECAHGTLPVPAPAVLEILKGVPVKTGAVPFEAATPTGAAIVRALADDFTEVSVFTPEKTGYGIGSREGSIPNVLRVVQGTVREVDTGQTEEVLVECNIDDMNPELYDHVIQVLLDAGAADVFLTPIIMKKSRPGILLQVLVSPQKLEKIEQMIFLETSTLGVRTYVVRKKALPRDVVTLDTCYGPVQVKRAYLDEKVIKSKPEYEECRRIARERGITIQEVYRAIRDAQADGNQP